MNAGQNMPDVMPFDRLGAIPGFFAFTTTRAGGCSRAPYDSLNLGLHVGDNPEAVLANRQALLPFLKGTRPVCMRQVHGTSILKVGSQQAGTGWISYETGLADCDGAVCREAGLALSVGVADCLALILVDPEGKAFGVAHAGWRGALGNIAQKLVAALKREYGCDPGKLWGGMSPCLGPCCLELDEQTYCQFNKAFPGFWNYHSSLEDGHFKLNLWELVKNQLAEEGVNPANLEIQDLCTKDHHDLFYSYRRDNGITGRMLVCAGFIEL